MGKEKRMIGDYTVLSSVNVGEKEIIIAFSYKEHIIYTVKTLLNSL